VTTPTVPKQADEEREFPESWIFDTDGDLVAGQFIRFSEGQTKEYGSKPILVLLVDGAERGIWLSQAVLFNRFRDELQRRASRRLEPGEMVVIERLDKKTSESGRSYWAFRTAFPDRPEKNEDDLFGLNSRIVKTEEPAKGDVGPDGEIPF
jgi:hypothetical protein